MHKLVKTQSFCRGKTSITGRDQSTFCHTSLKRKHWKKMETRLVFLLAALLATALLESKPVLPTLASEADHSVSGVFKTGKFHPIHSDVGTASSCSPPRSLLIVRPEEKGTCPVILFHHGTGCQNSWYTDVFKFISSHGYIVVAPQVLLFPCPFLIHPNILYKSIHSSWVSCLTFNKSNLISHLLGL
jgi:chlorophyllase